MTLTRDQKKEAFKNIAVVVLQFESFEIKSFQNAGITDINIFLNMNDAILNTMQITTTNLNPNVSTPITMTQKLKVLQFMYYMHFLDCEGNSPEDGDWITMTIDGLDQFCRGNNIRQYTGKTLDNLHTVTHAVTLAATRGATTTGAKTLTPVQEFDKGVKRDSAAFPILKDERFWDEYLRTTKATAHTQRVDNVLDPLYIPVTTDDKALFDRQQAYMYSVAQRTLQTDKGQELVREHDETYDAQKVYAALLKYHELSTKAINQASDLLTHITSNRLGLETWPNTTEAYVVHWHESIRKYHKLIPSNQKISDAQQMTMLQNAVHAVTELRAVKERAESEHVLHGNIMTYDQYCTLLQSACQQYDSTNRTTARRPANRHVYNHDITFVHDEDDQYNPNDDPSFDIDTPLDVISAFATQTQRLPGSSMPFAKWSQMDQKHKDIWDQLPDEVKALILSGTTSSNNTPSRPGFTRNGNHSTGRGTGHGNGRPSFRPQTQTPSAPIQRLVNLHEISAHDYLANLHELEQTDYGDDGNDVEIFQDAHQQDDDDDNSNAILAHLMQREQIPPSDIHHMLSSTMA